MMNYFINSNSMQNVEYQSFANASYYQISFPLSDTYIQIKNNVSSFVPVHVKIFNSATFPVIFQSQFGSGVPYVIQPNQLKSVNITGIEEDTYIIRSSYTSSALLEIEFYNFRDSQYSEPVEVMLTQSSGIVSSSIVNTVSSSIVNTVEVSQVPIQASFSVLELSSNYSYTNTYSFTSNSILNIYQTPNVSGFTTYLIANSQTANITSISQITMYGFGTYTIEVISTSQATPTNYQAIVNVE